MCDKHDCTFQTIHYTLMFGVFKQDRRISRYTFGKLIERNLWKLMHWRQKNPGALNIFYELCKRYEFVYIDKEMKSFAFERDPPYFRRHTVIFVCKFLSIHVLKPLGKISIRTECTSFHFLHSIGMKFDMNSIFQWEKVIFTQNSDSNYVFLTHPPPPLIPSCFAVYFCTIFFTELIYGSIANNLL